jgi:hypothetical protein
MEGRPRSAALQGAQAIQLGKSTQSQYHTYPKKPLSMILTLWKGLGYTGPGWFPSRPNQNNALFFGLLFRAILIQGCQKLLC